VDDVSLTAAKWPGNQPEPFKIDIKLLNTGSQVAVVNGVRLVIQQFVALPLCATAGDFLSTGAYTANMPTAPSPRQVVRVPISQVVPAGGADRFDVQLRVPLFRTTHQPHHFKVYLYRVHAYLAYNVETKPADLGEILVALPISPDAGEFYWSHYYAANPQIIKQIVDRPHIPAYKRCAISNSRALHFILALPARRTADMAAILSQLAY